MLFRYLHHGSIEAFYKVRRTIPLGIEWPELDYPLSIERMFVARIKRSVIRGFTTFV